MLQLAKSKQRPPQDKLNIDRLKELMLNDAGFAFDPQTGFTYNITQTGIDIIRWLKEGYRGDDVVERILRHYAVDVNVATRDYESLVGALRSHSLISDIEKE